MDQARTLGPFPKRASDLSSINKDLEDLLFVNIILSITQDLLHQLSQMTIRMERKEKIECHRAYVKVDRCVFGRRYVHYIVCELRLSDLQPLKSYCIVFAYIRLRFLSDFVNRYLVAPHFSSLASR